MAEQKLTGAAFAALLLTAFMMGANHVAARLAFNHGVDVLTAVGFRSLTTSAVLGLILWHQKVSFRVQPAQRWALLAIGVLIAVQSVCLYSAVSRLPVALALLVFNTYPISIALCARIFYGHRPDRFLLALMPVMLLGLALALDVLGAASGLGAQAQWGQIGVGVLLGLAASLTFGLAMVITQHEVAGLDGRLRSFTTLCLVAVLACMTGVGQGGFHWPLDGLGWLGLFLLSGLYGTAFTIMFILLPRLGVVGHSPIMNMEPVFALVLAWALLGQAIAPVQLLGAAVVMGSVLALGLQRR